MKGIKIDKGEKGREVMESWGYLIYEYRFVVLILFFCLFLFCSSQRFNFSFIKSKEQQVVKERVCSYWCKILLFLKFGNVSF